MNRLRQELESLFPGCEAVITSRGITALYLALAAVRALRGDGEVIVPATVCPSVALAVVYAGLIPRFCDVEPDTFCLSERTVRDALSDATKAILVVYLFGKSLDVKPIADVARRAGALVIEDLAQGIGGSANGRMLGQDGGCSILSFNEKKILCGCGGAGALVSQDARLLAAADELQQQLPGPLPAHESRELATSFRNFTHGLYGAMRCRGLEGSTSSLREMAGFYERLFVFRQNMADEQLAQCARALQALPAERARRHSYYQLFAGHFDTAVPYVRFLESEMCWRLPVLLPTWRHQTELVTRLRNQGLLVSDHYFPASHVLGDGGPANAREIGLRAVNFFVDGRTGREDIPTICRQVNRIFHEGEWTDV